MFAIFGWERTSKPVETVLETHCYHCNNKAEWQLYKVTEWVSFFFIRLVPFISKHYVACSICGDFVELNSNQQKLFRNVGRQRSGTTHDRAAGMIEDHQLAGKTDVQKNWIRTMRQGQGGYAGRPTISHYSLNRPDSDLAHKPEPE